MTRLGTKHAGLRQPNRRTDLFDVHWGSISELWLPEIEARIIQVYLIDLPQSHPRRASAHP